MHDNVPIGDNDPRDPRDNEDDPRGDPRDNEDDPPQIITTSDDHHQMM